jgi:hypothetical protein
MAPSLVRVVIVSACFFVIVVVSFYVVFFRSPSAATCAAINSKQANCRRPAQLATLPSD